MATASAQSADYLHPRRSSSSEFHYVRRANRMIPPFAQGLQTCVFAAGCFWGTEKGFWRLPGVYSTAVGYVDGVVEQPTYRAVCSGRTGHTEATLVVWDPSAISIITATVSPSPPRPSFFVRARP